MNDELEQAIEKIAPVLYACSKELANGLHDGSNPEWGYDHQLVFDIANAVKTWHMRTGL